ncbi:hypothetical protein BJV82DRAFT_599187 [Fennellomyces sp. T-0311]|nr:hypothetical protein BJV82DRAFT_599187 [Fennellomyces sp. T-0311]
MPMGYAQSKYIVEHIFNYLITEKDFPCFIERLGQVCGDTTRGEWNTNEHYPVTIIGGARMKMMPDLSTQVDWLPVDIASLAIVEAMINMPDKPITHFSHIVHPRRMPWSKVLEIMKECGMDFIVVTPQEWVEELRKDQSNPAYRLLPFFERNWVSAITMPHWETKKSVLTSASLGDAPVFSAELLAKSLDTWRKDGTFDISHDRQRCAGI